MFIINGQIEVANNGWNSKFTCKQWMGVLMSVWYMLQKWQH